MENTDVKEKDRQKDLRPKRVGNYNAKDNDFNALSRNG